MLFDLGFLGRRKFQGNPFVWELEYKDKEEYRKFKFYWATNVPDAAFCFDLELGFQRIDDYITDEYRIVRDIGMSKFEVTQILSSLSSFND